MLSSRYCTILCVCKSIYVSQSTIRKNYFADQKSNLYKATFLIKFKIYHTHIVCWWDNYRNASYFYFKKMYIFFFKYQVLNVKKHGYLNTTVSSIAPKHWTIFVAIRASTFSSRCRFGSCLPTFFMANCSGVIFSSSSKAYKDKLKLYHYTPKEILNILCDI